MRCKYCGHVYTQGDTYCSGCGHLSSPVEDKSIADYAHWFVIGAILNLFTLLIYVIIRNKKPQIALSMLLGMFALFSWYEITEIINLIFK
jgi:hypothetical protein